MIHKKPLTHKTQTPRPLKDAVYQWRGWGDDVKEALPKLRRKLTLDDTEKRNDTHVIVPGRADKHISLNDNDLLEIRSLQNTNDDIEEWAVMFRSELPLSRSTAISISQRIPRLGASLVMAENTQELTQKLARGVKVFPVKKTRKTYIGEGVTARISKLNINGETQQSLTLVANDPEKIRSLLKRFNLRPRRNRNLVDVLSEAKVPVAA